MSSRIRLQSTAVVIAALGLGGAQAQSTDDTLLPPNARPGECYARVFVPPRYEEFTETVLLREASKKLTATEPRYQWVEEKILVEEGYPKLEVVPAKFDWVEERVMVKDASEKLVLREATYKTIEEQIMVRPASTTWKPGRGLIEKIDFTTGEIMCLVETPAEYQTIQRRVVDTAAGWQKVSVPAEYQTLEKRVMVEPPRTRTVTMPPKYETVRVQKLIDPARVNETEIPADYASLTKVKKISEGHLEWRSVLCETNAKANLVADIQRALLRSGFDPGPIDGVIGHETMAAAQSFQQAKGLATGNLTMETLKALGVAVR